MHQLLSEFPIEAINKIKNLLGKIQSLVQIGWRILREMVDVDVEMKFVGGIVVGFGERVEAAGERGEAVEGEDFDEECEVGGRGWGWE